MIKFIIIVLILTIMIIIENSNLTTKKYNISDKFGKNNKPLKIALLSDLHNNSFGKKNKRLIDRINKENPDLILISGDMLVSRKNSGYEVSLELLKNLSKKYTIFYGNGNHEQKIRLYTDIYENMYNEYTDKLKALGIKILVNETDYFEWENKKIAITGSEIGREYYKKYRDYPMNENYLEEIIGKSSKELYQILIAHNPVYFKEYVNWGADLTVSGHIHGGIMILPFLGGVLSPQVRFFPKYYKGHYKINNKSMVVSAGLGLHTIKIRLFNRPELVIINLINSEN